LGLGGDLPCQRRARGKARRALKRHRLLGNQRWALMHELRGADDPKLEVWRAEVGKPTLWPSWPGIVAIASDTPAPASASASASAVKQLELAHTAAIANFVRAEAAGR
jgi:molybdopterin-guanine dinucleotide biosynthesis protein B